MDLSPQKEPRLIGKKKFPSGNFCCALGCSNWSGKDKFMGVKQSYFTFPKNDKRRASWLKAIPRIHWASSTYSKICSDHFIGGE